MSWILLAFTAAILEGLASVYEKKTLFKEHAMQFSAVLAIFTALITLPVLLKPDFSHIGPLPAALIVAGSILASLGFLFATKGVRHTEISVSSPLFMLSPGITALLAFLLLGESLKPLQIFGILLLVAGGYVLEMKRGQSIRSNLKEITGAKYIHYIFIALLIFGTTAIFDRLVLGYYRLDPKTYLALIQICIAINFIIMMQIFHGGLKDIWSGIRSYGLSVLVIALMAVAYRFAQSTATSMAYVGLVISIKRTSSFFSTLIGGEMFKEENLGQKAAACLVMLLGLIMLVI